MRATLERTVRGQIIRDLRKERKLTLRDLCSSAHVSLGYLSEVERGEKEVSSEVFNQIIEGLNIPIYEFYSEMADQMKAASDV